MPNNKIRFGRRMEIIKSRGNKRISVPIHSDSRFSLTILEILIPLASFHSILFVIFSCCNISLLISPAKKINKHRYPSSIKYFISTPNTMFSEISPKFIREIMPKIAATALINIKFQFNTLLRFNVIKPIRHPS